MTLIAVVLACASLVCALFSWVAFRMSRLHLRLSEAYRLIADMLQSTDLREAESKAAVYMEKLKAADR